MTTLMYTRYMSWQARGADKVMRSIAHYLLFADNISLRKSLNLFHARIGIFKGVLRSTLVDVSLAFENEEELAIGGFDGESADECVRFETIDCSLAILLGGVVGAFVDVVAAGIVECVEILLSAVFFVHVL